MVWVVLLIVVVNSVDLCVSLDSLLVWVFLCDYVYGICQF